MKILFVCHGNICRSPMAEFVMKALVKALPAKPYRTSGDPESGWIVVDYIDVVVHVFSPEARAYYALEKLWE